MIYILFGPDDFSLKEELVHIKEGMGDREMLSTNTTVFEGQTLTPEQLMSTCDTVPFLAEKRLVIVNGLLGRFELKRGKGRSKKTSAKSDNVKNWFVLKEYVGRMPKTTALILIDGDIEQKKNRLFKELQSVIELKKFPLLKDENLHTWINSRVTARKGTISSRAVKSLAGLGGSNLGVLANEIDKLLLYTEERCIEKDDVEYLVSYTRDTSIFALVDAILEQHAPLAMLLLHRLLSEGSSPSYIMVMIARQLRLLILIEEMKAQNMHYREMQRRLGLTDYPFRKTMEKSGVHSIERLKGAYRRLLDTDVAMKTGMWKSIQTKKWKDELILDVLIAELCSKSTLSENVS